MSCSCIPYYTITYKSIFYKIYTTALHIMGMGMLWVCYGYVMGMLWVGYGYVMGRLWYSKYGMV